MPIKMTMKPTSARRTTGCRPVCVAVTISSLAVVFTRSCNWHGYGSDGGGSEQERPVPLGCYC
eukprot:SAG31_NODE_4101_length_3583_cov_1.895522_4_plen_63_part_00